MIEQTDALRNIRRVLKTLGLDDALNWDACRAEEDRVFVWPVDDRVLRYVVVMAQWKPELRSSAESHHGTKISYREPEESPSLQVCFHRAADALAAALETPPGLSYFLELDLDFHNPGDGPVGLFGHAGEVLRNTLSGTKTDQAAIARALDKRFA